MSKHTPDQWVPIVALPPNPKVPDHYGHISECCGSVLMPPWEYEHARLCVEACQGLTDPAAEITALREQVRRLTAEKTDMCNRNALLRARPDVPTERLAEHDRLVSEMDQLREAVKLLGAHIMHRNGYAKGTSRFKDIEASGTAIAFNPIAAAAVRGEP